MIFTPTDIHAMRNTTERRKPMAGVTMPSFICARCKQEKLTLGRKQVVRGSSRFGYVCRECAK